ncbi:hypothetical protein AJ79_05261 [Helicocarpus griseus UAMH5409]|uniref:Uncharacterized protein n=1 Tax=Helicocarpus griseus UAMH5409 TaxID=1447875 RepID=A0A2B7XQA9_9EURO|nr:hypothetical protein AJ79_05261 [Helicocarpus griseus UAMH5409]
MDPIADRIVCTDPQAESKETGDKGLGLFATSHLRPGDNVFAITANFATVLDTDRLADTCSNCFATVGDEVNPDLTLKACTGCRVVKYCDTRCQSESWAASHKKECKIYKKWYPKILPSNGRAVLRIISEPDRPIFKEMYLHHVAATNTLSYHFSEMRKRDDEQLERVAISAEALKALTETDAPLEALLVLFTKLETNAVTLTNQYFDTIGLCLLPFASYTNHSCEPNAYIGFDGQVMYMKALQDIRPGEQIYISYIDNTNPFETRQRELRSRYFFTCHCPKCLKGTNTREDEYLNNETPPSQTAIDEAYRILAMLKARNCPPSKPPHARPAVGLMMLQSSGCWPITRQFYPQLHDELIVKLLDEKRFKSAFMPAAVRHLRIDPVLYTNPLHPIRKRNMWAFAKLVRYLNDPADGDESPARTEYEHRADFVWLWYSLLSDLNRTYNDTLRLRALLQTSLKDIIEDLKRSGVDFKTAGGQRQIKTAVDNAWQNLEKTVDKLLSRKPFKYDL